MVLKARDWKGLISKHGVQGTATLVESWLDRGVKGETGGISFNELSLHQIVEGTIPDGREFINSMNPAFDTHTEAIDAIDMTAFNTITRNIVAARVMAERQGKGLVLQNLIPNESTNRNGSMLPGIQSPGSDFEEIKEMQSYPYYQVGEDYLETPKGKKFGRIIAVTKEAVFFDIFNIVLREAAGVGRMLYVNKEKRIAQGVAGLLNNHKRQGTTYNTYLTSGKWINDQANPVDDHTCIDNSKALFHAMVDFNNGEKITVMPTTIIGSEMRESLWASILNARYVQRGDGASNSVATVYDNPIQGRYNFVSAPYLEEAIVNGGLANSTQVLDWWFHGDFSKAFKYLENWPVTVIQAPRNSLDEFKQDIVAQYRASERGQIWAEDPQHVVRNKHTP